MSPLILNPLPDSSSWRNALAVALVLIGQMCVTAHAVELGSEPHEHNGIVCLALLSDEQDDVLPTKQCLTPRLKPTESASCSVSIQILPTKHLAIRPPSTGPPTV